MKYCSACGAEVRLEVPQGDNRPRYVCPACGTIHYQNPNIVAGCIPFWEDQVLLCRRAIEPKYGLWTLPAGFMENDETAIEAAIRETVEEAGARLQKPRLYTVFSLPHVNQVYMMYRAQLADLDFEPGSESLEAAMYQQHQVPWGEMAFAVIEHTLRLYYEDYARGEFAVHHGDVRRIQLDPAKYELTLF